jgi:hypothetical protein
MGDHAKARPAGDLSGVARADDKYSGRDERGDWPRFLPWPYMDRCGRRGAGASASAGFSKDRDRRLGGEGGAWKIRNGGGLGGLCLVARRVPFFLRTDLD